MIRQDLIRAYFATHKILPEPEILGAILKVLEAEKDTAPRSWGYFQSDRNKFERDAIFEAVGALTNDAQSLFLRRPQPNKYEFHFTLRRKELNHMIVRFPADPKRKHEHFARIMSLTDKLAAILEPEFGVVQPTAPDDRYYDTNAVGNYTFESLQDYGPLGLAARTWLGPHLVKLFANVDWSRLDAKISETPWGGLFIESVRDLEGADFDRLDEARRAAADLLAPTGVLASLNNNGTLTKGENWRPISEP